MTDAVDYLPLRTCPACSGEKHPGIILCLDCWGKVREETKELLLMADVYAVGRRKEFYKQIALQIPLQEIILAEDGHNYEREPVVHRHKVSPAQDVFEFMASVPTRQRRKGRR